MVKIHERYYDYSVSHKIFLPILFILFVLIFIVRLQIYSDQKQERNAKKNIKKYTKKIKMKIIFKGNYYILNRITRESVTDIDAIMVLQMHTNNQYLRIDDTIEYNGKLKCKRGLKGDPNSILILIQLKDRPDHYYQFCHLLFSGNNEEPFLKYLYVTYQQGIFETKSLFDTPVEPVPIEYKMFQLFEKQYRNLRDNLFHNQDDYIQRYKALISSYTNTKPPAESDIINLFDNRCKMSFVFWYELIFSKNTDNNSNILLKHLLKQKNYKSDKELRDLLYDAYKKVQVDQIKKHDFL